MHGKKFQIVAKPGRTRGQSGQDQKKPALFADFQNAALRIGEEHQSPGHEQNHKGSDCGSQIGIDAVNTDLGQYGSKCRKDK